MPYEWVQDEPISVGVTSSTGIQTTEEIPAAVETPSVGGRSVARLRADRLPRRRRAHRVRPALAPVASPRGARSGSRRSWRSPAGLLTFLALEALGEALELQAALPGGLGGPGLVLLGVAGSYLTLVLISSRFGEESAERGAPLGGLALATLVAIGIGLHNLGEGLAIGSSFALGELALGTFFIVGFMVHNITEGLGIAAPGRRGQPPREHRRLAVLTLIAGAPAILGAWLGGFVTSDFLGVVFFAAAAGAALEVVTEVGRYVVRKAPGGVRSPLRASCGFFAGLAVMYVTGLLV